MATTGEPAVSFERKRAPLVVRLLAIVGVAAAIAGGWTAVDHLRGRAASNSVTEELPRLVRVGEFVLTDESERPFGAAQMRGHTSVVDFFFTSCPTICPVLTRHMRDLQTRARPGSVQFVSISVDPEVDTPEVMRNYANTFQADLSSWRFLTGETARVDDVVERIFRQPLDARARAAGAPGSYNIVHSGRVMLVDRDLWVRGLYDATPGGAAELLRDLERL